MPKPPNILVLMCDHHRYDALSCLGNPLAHTPHLDALAARSVRFSNCFNQSPVCAPTRHSLATGRYCHAHGVITNQHKPFPGMRTIGPRAAAVGLPALSTRATCTGPTARWTTAMSRGSTRRCGARPCPPRPWHATTGRTRTSPGAPRAGRARGPGAVLGLSRGHQRHPPDRVGGGAGRALSELDGLYRAAPALLPAQRAVRADRPGGDPTARAGAARRAAAPSRRSCTSAASGRT